MQAYHEIFIFMVSILFLTSFLEAVLSTFLYGVFGVIASTVDDIDIKKGFFKTMTVNKKGGA